MRLAGILIACSTPITGFLSYAAIAIAFGEDRLENSGGSTALGLVALGAPLLIGVSLVLWSFLSARTPSLRSLTRLSAAVGLLLLGLGLRSVLSSDGDASIGGGLLVLAAVPLIVFAIMLARTRYQNATGPAPR